MMKNLTQKFFEQIIQMNMEKEIFYKKNYLKVWMNRYK